jgi:5-methylcytosine-specific restriction endonuclease McrA
VTWLFVTYYGFKLVALRATRHAWRTNKKPRSLRNGVLGKETQYLMMLTRRTEFHVRPALFHQCPVDPGRGEVGQVTAAVDHEVFHSLGGEFLQQLSTALNQAHNW